MNITMFGSMLCQDTVYATVKLKDKGASLTFRNITSDFSALKEFMRIRESDPLFDDAKKNDKIGVPFFVFEDGFKTLDINEVLEKMSS